MKNPTLRVDDTTIMLMIPVNGKMNTTQPLVTPKKGGGVLEVQRVTAQYKKIENELATVTVPNSSVQYYFLFYSLISEIKILGNIHV